MSCDQCHFHPTHPPTSLNIFPVLPSLLSVQLPASGKMSVTVSKADGATVLTVVSDPNGHLPPLCQILKALCHSLAGCSVPPHLKRVRRASLLVLGTLHIMIGLLSFSLGLILHFSESCCRLIDVTSFPYWSGILFVIFGIICILCEKKPCLYLVLSVGVSGVLVGLSALELCVAISALVLAIKVLKSFKRNENLSSSEPEQTTNPEITEVPYEICIISTRRRSCCGNMFPSPCRILKALCCRCLKKLGVQTCWAAAAGTVQIMVGVLNIGLGPGRTSTRLGDFTSLGAAYWLGAVFVVTGIMTVLAGRFPSSCLVGFTVFLNIVGAIFSITGIVLYAIDLNNSSLLWVCDRSGSDPDRYDDSCRNMAAFDQNLLTSLDKALILLAVLLLVVSFFCCSWHRVPDW
ncbi:PREDICTED: uncharacterized protein LOC106904669 [Poecilia mexicana]|uniref:uncharacterized protein LOC106904669 n=1 Tax=Poecilia mexicana TaxID=48701 RepID=UPI00072E1F93|nr:PREDICTED: uncharacterized protein LOC106904669 [Poecilia mexicana]